MTGRHLKRTLLIGGAAAAVAIAAGSALAIIGLGANIRGDTLTGTDVDGKAAGLSITLKDQNLISGLKGVSSTSVQSNAETASFKHVCKQRTAVGGVTIKLQGKRTGFMEDPAAGVAATRQVLADIRGVTDQIAHTGAAPSVLPPGVVVKVTIPQGVDPVVLKTARVLIERHLILGFSALATSYAHEVVGNTGASSSVEFGPAFLDGVDTKVTENP